MLQRSQSLFLLAVFLLSLTLLTGPFARIQTEAGDLLLKHSGYFSEQGDRLDAATWPLSVLFSVVTLLSFLNIFFYRNRIRQIRICVFLMLVFLGVEGIMFYYAWIIDQLGFIPLWRFVVPPINIILAYLAMRRIRRDELLVKAYDRIR